MRPTMLWLAAVAAIGVGCSGPLHRDGETGRCPVVQSSGQATDGPAADPSKEAASRVEPVAPFPSEENPRPLPESTPLSRCFIKIDEAKKQFDNGVQFFDARGKEEFNAGHVKGAVLIDPTDDAVVGARAKPAFLDKFDARLAAIVYCNGGDCDSSQLVVIKLRQFGFANVKIFEEGFPVWKAKGYPIEPKVIR